MQINDSLFIEVDSKKHTTVGNLACGDVYLQKRYDDFLVAILFSGGDGDSVRRNVVASLLCSVAINNLNVYGNINLVAQSIVRTILHDREDLSGVVPGFTIVKIDNNAFVEIVNFLTPRAICCRENIQQDFESHVHDVEISDTFSAKYEKTTFKAEVEDRIVFFSNGMLDTSFNNLNFAVGVSWESILRLVSDKIEQEHEISAHDLSNYLIDSGYGLEKNHDKRDKSCAVVYFRKPRKVLICTGPPYNQDKDKYLANRIKEYPGDTIICGGTTAGIVSRELNREVRVLLGRDPSGLPNASSMDGVTMVTEGVLTLGRVKGLLESLNDINIKGRGIDVDFVRTLMSHDVIEFLVGTRINAMHQDPNIPIELELRRNVVKDIAKLIKDKFMKEVILEYI